jgi:hypothetical protein
MKEVEDQSQWSSITMTSDGNIIIKPSSMGVIKLGGDNADKALVCTDLPALEQNGIVSAGPLVTTMGGQFAGTKISGQGTYASKILVVG